MAGRMDGFVIQSEIIYREEAPIKQESSHPNCLALAYARCRKSSPSWDEQEPPLPLLAPLKTVAMTTASVKAIAS